MHELSICQALLRQVEDIARREGADRVTKIILRVGPLGGVEPQLLQQAFGFARVGTLAAEAELSIEEAEILVHCLDCDAEGQALANRLLCPVCGSYRTRLLRGDELILASLELTRTTRDLLTDSEGYEHV